MLVRPHTSRILLRTIAAAAVVLSASLVAAQDWETAANARIEAIRKGDFAVQFVDGQGNPLQGVVDVTQTRSHFLFGTAVAGDPTATTNRETAYRQFILDHFNVVTPENAMKWPSNEPAKDQGDFALADKLVDYYVDQHGLAMRGHALYWSWKQEPAWFYDLSQTDLAEARVEVRERATFAAGRYAGKLIAWDVNNEMLLDKPTQGWFEQTFGPGTHAQMFQWAAAEDLSAKLFVNEVGITNASGISALVQSLQAQGANVGGIGLQEHNGHLWTSATPAQKLAVLDQLATLGLPIHISEISVASPDRDRQLQADQLEDILRVAFSHPSVDAAILWGFADFRHWLSTDGAGLLAIDTAGNVTLNPAGQRLHDRLINEWRTSADDRSLVDGLLNFRGFYGDYAFALTDPSGQVHHGTASLVPGQLTAVVVAPEPASLLGLVLLPVVMMTHRRRTSRLWSAAAATPLWRDAECPWILQLTLCTQSAAPPRAKAASRPPHSKKIRLCRYRTAEVST